MTRCKDREAMSRCGETCPAVDGAFADLLSDLSYMVPPALFKDAERLVEQCCETVKEKGTLLLRAALVDTCDDLLSSRESEADAERRVKELEWSLDDARHQIKHLEEELAEVSP